MDATHDSVRVASPANASELLRPQILRRGASDRVLPICWLESTRIVVAADDAHIDSQRSWYHPYFLILLFSVMIQGWQCASQVAERTISATSQDACSYSFLPTCGKTSRTRRRRCCCVSTVYECCTNGVGFVRFL